MASNLDVYPLKQIELHTPGPGCWCIPVVEHAEHGDVIHHNRATLEDLEQIRGAREK